MFSDGNIVHFNYFKNCHVGAIISTFQVLFQAMPASP